MGEFRVAEPIARDGSWTTKSSTAVQCKGAFLNAKNVNSVNEEIIEYKRISDTAKKHMKEVHQEKSIDKVKSLAVQGRTLELALAEKSDFTWKSFLYELKVGTLKFLVNAVIDTLPTNAYLKRWKKSPSDKCKLCMSRQTTAHCLNICKVSLDTGRWTWRHNNIVNFEVNSLDTTKYTIHSDIAGH